MKTEYLILPESMVVVALCLVGLIIIAASLIGYFIGLSDGRRNAERRKGGNFGSNAGALTTPTNKP